MAIGELTHDITQGKTQTADNKEDLVNVSSFSGFLNVDSILLRIKKLIHPCISAPR